MVGVLVGLAIGQQLTFGKLHNRAEFYAAAAKIKEDWSKQQVEALLGKPDDIWPATDGRRYTSNEDVWCYGTNGHHTFPTLGRVMFTQGKVRYWTMPGKATSTRVISEAELRDGLRKLHRFSYIDQLDDGAGSMAADPIRMIETVNALQPMGTRKALAVIDEYSRVGGSSWDDHDFLFWLVRVLFVGKKPGYTFPVPAIGAIYPAPPKDMSKWPTFPVQVIRGFPINVFQGAALGGFPEPFTMYFESHKAEWQIRPEKLTPPDDPFSVVYEVKKTTEGRSGGSSGVDRPNPEEVKRLSRLLPSDPDDTLIRGQIIRAVRSVAKFREGDWGTIIGFGNARDYYLSLGGHWDAAKQRYVRRDGSYDPDVIMDYPMYTHKYAKTWHLSTSIEVYRENREVVSIFANYQEDDGMKIGTAILLARDADTQKELAWMNINSETLDPYKTWEQVVRENPHAAHSGARSTGFRFAPGHRVIFELIYDGKIASSPVFKL